MTDRLDRRATIVPAVATVAPGIIIVLASIGVRTPVATAYPLVALLLFLWSVADTMMLSLVARLAGRPAWHAVLAVMAGASVIVLVGSPPALRAAAGAKPVLGVLPVVLIVAHCGWAAARAKHVLAKTDPAAPGGWADAAAALLPRPLVRFAAAEWSVLHMAVFRWGGPADVPANGRPFSYHRHLAPMGATLLILSSIEIAVYHLLVAHWSRTVAVVMFVLSDLGFVYLLGLIKSFRFRPVLLTPAGVTIRAGLLIDEAVPIGSIVGVETSFTGDAVRDAATLNAALLAWPNILLRLDRPLARRSLLRGTRHYNAIAFRLDDPAPFVRLLRWRLGQPPA